MNLLSWMMPLFLLSAGTSLAAVNVNWLTGIVKGITELYGIRGQYCLAANIPENQDPNTLPSILPGKQDVVTKLNMQNQIYISNSIVVAKKNEPDHAERRVLENMQTLTTNSEGKVLLIYSYLSPCGDKCANPDDYTNNILNHIRTMVSKYKTNIAFVFTTVFDSPKYGMEISKDALKETLQHLGGSGLGLENIFRCFRTKQLGYQCYSCSEQQRVSDVCVDNKFQPGQGGSSDLLNRKRPGYRSPSESSSGSSSSGYNIREKKPRNRSPSSSSSRWQGRG